MSVLNSFKGFVTKEVYHILRDYRSLIVLFGMPLIMLLMFGYAIRNEPREAQVGVLDLAKDTFSNRIIKKLNNAEEFDVTRQLSSRKQADALFEKGAVKQVVVLEPDLRERWLAGETVPIQVINDASDPNTATLLYEYARSIIQDFNQRELKEMGAAGAGTGGQVGMVSRNLFNPQLKSVYIFVPGLIAVILMLISALMTSITITREKEMGSMEVLLVSPLRPLQIIVGKIVPYMALSLINVLTVLILARLVFNVPFEGSFALFMLEAFLFIFVALALGLLISTVSNNQQTAMMIALAGLLLPTVMLSGFIFPIASMPEPLQWFSAIIPARWFLVVVRGIMLKGVGLEALWQETLILGGMAVFLVTVSVNRFQVRLEQ